MKVRFGAWTMEYTPGARLADICDPRGPVDCVEVRDWDWTKNPADQMSPIPDERELRDILRGWVLPIGEDD